MTIRRPGRPRMKASRINETTGFDDPGIIARMIMYKVNAMAAGKTSVPTSSIKTTNCIEKQNVPQRSRTSTSSAKL